MSVLQSLYLLFNEGYKASSGENLVREELCEEAIRLAELLVATSGRQSAEDACAAGVDAVECRAQSDAAGRARAICCASKSRTGRAGTNQMIARGMFHFARIGRR